MAASVSRGSIGRSGCIPKFHPYRRMVACALHSTRLAVDASILQTLRQSGTQQNVVETQAAIAFPTLPHVVPKRIHRFFGMERANGVGPTLRKKALIRGAALGLQQGVAIPGLRRVDVEVCGHDVVISRQHDWRSGRVEFGRVGVQALQPSELVIEFGTGLRVSVRSVDRGDEHAVNGRLEIAALPVGGVAWQVHAGHHRRPPREDRHAVPALLAAPYRLITGLPDCVRRKLGVRGFEFLKADDVGLGLAKPAEQVRQATVDVVDVETGDLHRSATDTRHGSGSAPYVNRLRLQVRLRPRLAG